jgi:phosphoserine aminotransferase
MGKSKYRNTVDWDDMSYGEAQHHIGKKTTQKTHKSKKDFRRKPKHNKWDSFDEENF